MDETYYTLIFIKTSDKVLLGFKKRGFGKNTWNGYGGKLEKNEDPFDGAIRELYEESNLTVKLSRRIVYIFTASKISGDLQETEEMKPKWFKFGSIPYEKMWPDSQYWLSLVLGDCWLHAFFTYKGDCELVHSMVMKLLKQPTPDNVQNLHYEPF